MRKTIVLLLSLAPVFTLKAQQKIPDTGVIPDIDVTREPEILWGDYEIPDTFPELQILDSMDVRKSEEHLKKAREYFQLSLKTISEAKKQKESVPEMFKHLPEQHYWQLQDKQEKVRKKQNEIMNQAYQRSKVYIVKGLEEIEKIKSPKVIQTGYYINLKSNLLRHFVLTQLSLNDISGVITSIEEYFHLRESHKEEPQPYKILAYSYQKLEMNSLRSGAPENVVLEYRKKKYQNLMQYVILKYGKNSPQYEYLKNQIDRRIVQEVM